MVDRIDRINRRGFLRVGVLAAVAAAVASGLRNTVDAQTATESDNPRENLSDNDKNLLRLGEELSKKGLSIDIYPSGFIYKLYGDLATVYEGTGHCGGNILRFDAIKPCTTPSPSETEVTKPKKTPKETPKRPPIQPR